MMLMGISESVYEKSSPHDEVSDDEQSDYEGKYEAKKELLQKIQEEEPLMILVEEQPEMKEKLLAPIQQQQ